VTDPLVMQRLDSMAEDLKEIKDQTTRTNGRVTALEMAQAVSIALANKRARAFGFVPESVTTVVAVFIGWALATYVH
jgi:hypothetical protein